MKKSAVILFALSSLISVRAQADARFLAPSSYGLGASPVAAIADDFDGNGTLDIASATADGHAIVLPGLGDGMFDDALSSPISATAPALVNAIAALDADHDGRRDLVVAVAPEPQSCAAVILRGQLDGTFVSGVTLPIQPAPEAWNYGCNAVLAEDLDRDGNSDIVLVFGFISGMASPPLNTGFSLFRGHGDGTFELAFSEVLGADKSSLAVTAADVDSDGDLDLIFGEDVVYLSGPQSHQVVTLLGDGSGVFPTQTSQDTSASVGFARFEGVNAADYDGDGALDVALIADLDGFGNLPSSPKNAITLRGRGDGSFEPPVTFASTSGANSLVSADFDDDGAADLAIASFTDTGGGATLFAGARDGSFAAPIQVPLSAAPQSLIAADFNQDGRIDLAAVDASANLVAVALQASPRRHRCWLPRLRCWPRL